MRPFFICKDPVLDYRGRRKVGLAHLGILEPSQTVVRPPVLQIGDEESEVIADALVRARILQPSSV